MDIVSLKNQREFDLVNTHGRKAHGSCLILVLVQNFSHISNYEQGKPKTFLGMKVSRKFAKKAVIRNKAKRRIRHLMQDIANDQSIDISDAAFIVIPKRGLESVGFEKLSHDFRKNFLRLLEY
ncbi:ribonuclease P protein component [Rickettsiaceae bacterium]|nr:ribonuclease P protein component [Rickettsiaceae bacterium]